MNECNIYLSLKESEELIFEKILSIDKRRLEISKAGGNFSVNILFDRKYLIEGGGGYLILSSGVKRFIIPAKEENLFLNHYKLPLGLVETAKRKVRDQDSGFPFPENEDKLRNKSYYLKLRNGLINLFKVAHENDSASLLSKHSLEIINGFNSLSPFRAKFMDAVLIEGFFPTQRVTVSEFKPDSYFRFVWWGKFLLDYLLAPVQSTMSDEKIVLHKQWFKGLSDHQNFKSIEESIKGAPSLFQEDLHFIMGYYIAALNFESTIRENFENELTEYIFNVDTTHQEEILLWGIFFQSLFKEELSGLYFIPDLRNGVFEIEKLAFRLAQSNMADQIEAVEIVRQEIPQEEQLSQFIQLQHGGKKVYPAVVSSKDILTLFENKLSRNNLKNIGIVHCSEFERNTAIPNTCWASNGAFQLNLVHSPAEVTFYSNQDAAGIFLKDLKIKQKPLNKIINKKKKVLVGFLNGGRNRMIKTYSYITQAERSLHFEKKIFVWLVDRDVEEIQSTAFDLEKKSFEKDLANLFDGELILLIKNVRNEKDEEIKRSFRNLLSPFKLDQIEVIDEDFDHKKAAWLMAGNTEFFINDSKGGNYYSYFKN